ncbi:MAG TPA: hypothetical protein DDY52_03410 [Candidatus Moranbacteria bacterium]|nr:hypothetical protein [Candidatus Moranbacteria bacterium]
MAFNKQNPGVMSSTKKGLDIRDKEDLEIVNKFEKELESSMNKKTELFDGREITGFELYLHNKGLFRFSPQYPTGAVVMANVEAYRDAKDKYSALQDLWYKRDLAKKREQERLQTLAI